MKLSSYFHERLLQRKQQRYWTFKELAEKLFAAIVSSCPLAKTQAMTDEEPSVFQPRFEIVAWALYSFLLEVIS